MNELSSLAINSTNWLPYTFAFLMALSALIYAVLDGYDMGVGMLTPFAKSEEHKDKMVDSIGPFWDANETWLVLAIGLLLTAFPFAQGVVLSNLYLPVLFMLIGLIFRGVAIEYRKKVKIEKKAFWNAAFAGGSLLMAFSQGYMLGSYILGFESGIMATLLSILAGLALVAAYCLMGACWLIIRTEGEVQEFAINAAKATIGIIFIDTIALLIMTSISSNELAEKIFAHNGLVMGPAILICGVLLVLIRKAINKEKLMQQKGLWLPFSLTCLNFVVLAAAYCYCLFPYVIPGQMLIVEGAAANESLIIIFCGAVVVLPILIGYTFLVYRIFKGKTTDLSYD